MCQVTGLIPSAAGVSEPDVPDLKASKTMLYCSGHIIWLKRISVAAYGRPTSENLHKRSLVTCTGFV